MVFYFTATGNSLYVARQFSEAPVSIPQIMRGSQRRFSDSTIGIVCPVGNFNVEDGQAKRRQETCEFCLACVQNCPQKAIGLSMADKNPEARYRNEHISLQEIMAANGVQEEGEYEGN